MNGLISIIVRTVQGRAPLLERALRSLASQTYQALEILVIEDGSDSASATIKRVQALAPTRPIMHFPISKAGRSLAANAGLDNAAGEFIGFLDDDDLLHPTHCEILASLLNKHTYAAGAYSAAYVLSADLNPETMSFEDFKEKRVHYSPVPSSAALIEKNIFPIQAVLFRSSVITKMDRFDPNMHALEDWLFWLRLFLGRKLVSTSEVTSAYHIPASTEAISRRAQSHDAAYRYFDVQRTALYEARRLTDYGIVRNHIANQMKLACEEQPYKNAVTPQTPEPRKCRRLIQCLRDDIAAGISRDNSDGVVFTSINLRYLPKALVLARSIKAHSPNCQFHILLNDAVPSDANEWPSVDRVVPIGALGIDNFESWCFRHRVVELCTATKPFYFKALFESGWKKAIYLDPDTKVFSSLDPLLNELDSADWLLTPHCSEEARSEAEIHYNEVSNLAHGVFNLGFCAGRSSRNTGRIIEFWCRRMARHCVDDHARGLFTDQKWANLLPIMFDNVKVLKERSYNVASWNVSSRPISKRNGIWYAGGEKLVFFHFSGYDKNVPRRMFDIFGRYNQEIDELIDAYDKEVELFSMTGSANLAWALSTFDNGVQIEDSDRAWYRNHYEFELMFPKPFCAGGPGSYFSWLIGGGRVRIANELAPEGYIRQYY